MEVGTQHNELESSEAPDECATVIVTVPWLPGTGGRGDGSAKKQISLAVNTVSAASAISDLGLALFFGIMQLSVELADVRLLDILGDNGPKRLSI